MASPADQQLAARIKADPRVQQMVSPNGRGVTAGRLSSDQLQQLGYDVPDGYSFVWGGRSGTGTLLDNKRGLVEQAAPWAAMGMGAAAGAGAAGLIPGIGGIGGGAAGGGSLASAGAVGSAPGYVPASVMGTGIHGGASAAALETLKSGGGGGVLDTLKNNFGGVLSDPKNLAGLAALIPLLTQAMGSGGGGSNPFAGMDDEISKSLAMQRQRVEQTQPVFDTLVNMSYGSTPTRYRGAPPANYPATAQAAPAGPYAYKGPRFG